MTDQRLPPLPLKSRGALDAFNAHAEFIIAGWNDREQRGVTGRIEGANAWFKARAYALILHFIEHDLLSVLRKNLRQDERPHRLVEEAIRNPFKLGLLAMFSDDTLSRGNRHIFGNQMLYAWAHGVPPDFLNAFLAVTGGPAQIAAKLKTGNPEPGYEHRFKPERLRRDDA